MIGFRIFVMWAGVFLTLCLFISLMVSTYIAYKKLDSILQIMRDAPDGKIRLPWPGFQGKLIQLGQITGIIVFPQSAIKTGMATALEIESIPKAFKKQAITLFYVDTTVFALMTLYALILKFGLI
jgi:hypothetical protein